MGLQLHLQRVEIRQHQFGIQLGVRRRKLERQLLAGPPVAVERGRIQREHRGEIQQGRDRRAQAGLDQIAEDARKVIQGQMIGQHSA